MGWVWVGGGGMMCDVGCLVFSGGREGGKEEREREREVLPQTWEGIEGSLPAGFEGGGCERGEFGCDGEDAVEFPVRAGGCYGG